jgi:hypothetical protein
MLYKRAFRKEKEVITFLDKVAVIESAWIQWLSLASMKGEY